LKRYLPWPILVFFLVAATSSSYGQDGVLNFSGPWGNSATGSGEIFSDFGMDYGVDTLSRLMDFDASLSHSLDPDDFFDRFLHPTVTEDQEEKGLLSPFHMLETEKEMVFKAELLPGTGLGEVAISSDGEVLTVQAEKTEMNEASGDDYSQGEWTRESFTRITPLPGEVQDKELVTTYEDGVLTVTFPKSQ